MSSKLPSSAPINRINQITYSLFTLQDCFLTREEWREVLRLRDKGPVGDAIETFWLYFSQCPAIVRQAHRLRAKRLNNEPIDRTEIIDVSQQAETLHIRFLHWYRTIIGFLPLPEETPSQGPNALCPTTYKFPSVWIGSLFMGCWTSLLILQAILGECNFREEFAESNQELLEKVLKSVDYTAQGMMGPYRVGYALRIAVEFADPPTRKRIIDFLGRISSSFAAITPRNSARIFPLLAVGYPDRSALK